MNNVERFKKIASELGDLYAQKNKAYGNSFGESFKKLGIISAVTRISDKYNRLCNLATNPSINNLGESIDDTLRDLASYCIMTVIELEKKPNVINQDDIIKILAEIYHMADDAKNKIARDTLNSKSLNDLVNELISKTLDSAKTVLPEKDLS